jgi:capsular polysaccharide biosynthesis protein
MLFSNKVVMVVAGTFLGLLLGAVLAYLPGKSYQASITVYIAPPVSSSPTDAVMGDEYASNRAQLYLSLITSDPLLAAVTESLDTPLPADDIADRVTATAIHQTSLIRIDATGPNPESAVVLAKAYGLTLPDFAKTVEAQSGVREGPTVGVVTPPEEIGAVEVGMKPALASTVLGIVGGAVGFVVSAWYTRRFPVVRSPDGLRKVVTAPFVETVRLDRPSRNLERVQALILGAPRPSPLLFVAATAADTCTEFVTRLVESANSRDIPLRSTPLLDVDEVEIDDCKYTVFVAPALLDDGRQASLLLSRPFDTILVCRKGVTRMRSVADLCAILEANGTAIKGVFIVEGSAKRADDATVTDGANRDGPGSHPVLNSHGPGRDVQ